MPFEKETKAFNRGGGVLRTSAALLDSHSRLGPIRRANQGVFEIMGHDTADDAAPADDQASIDQVSIEKKVRLVSTVDYYLINWGYAAERFLGGLPRRRRASPGGSISFSS